MRPKYICTFNEGKMPLSIILCVYCDIQLHENGGIGYTADKESNDP